MLLFLLLFYGAHFEKCALSENAVNVMVMVLICFSCKRPKHDLVRIGILRVHQPAFLWIVAHCPHVSARHLMSLWLANIATLICRFLRLLLVGSVAELASKYGILQKYDLWSCIYVVCELRSRNGISISTRYHIRYFFQRRHSLSMITYLFEWADTRRSFLVLRGTPLLSSW